ncbi:MAG: DUF2961 domain-containing protein [Chloroflexi bacterium]|nr:DUF2961 domain-containing protein [Chloroflexota bacterium]
MTPNIRHGYLLLFKTKRRMVLYALVLVSLFSVAWSTGIPPQALDMFANNLSLSLFDSRAPNPVPDVAPPIRPPQPAPTIVLLPAAQVPENAPAETAPENLASPLNARVEKIPVFTSLDFLSGYLSNQSHPIIVEGQPWDFGSTNFVELKKPRGGTSYWDYWSEEVPWDSPNHAWQDQAGNWRPYTRELIETARGRTTLAHVLLERRGPGVMDKLWFTHDPTNSFMGILKQSSVFFWTTDPPEITEWGGLAKLGNLRIEVDGLNVFDGPIEDWFSGEAQALTPTLRKALVWRYRQFGSNGNIIPIPYQNHLKVWVYDGIAKPKWFMATGITLPPDAHVKPYTGQRDDLPLEQMDELAQTIMHPEGYIRALPNSQMYMLDVQADAPAALTFAGPGTLGAIQFKLSKQYDPRRLTLQVEYGSELGMRLPLLAFFAEPDQISLHHSSPVGLIDLGEEYLFYSNFPMPYRQGMTIELQTDSPSPISITAQVATLAQTTNTQLRVVYRPIEKLAAYGPDFRLNVEGNGKLVGLVLVTQDQEFDKVPRVIDPKTGEEDNAEKVWPMGYLEGNLTITDGAGNARYYSGQEDWAEGGYYFNSGYTTPPGGANMPFAGILRYQGGKNGFATLFRYFNDLAAFRFKNGLQLSFGHGTWQNNVPVSYGATLFYYHEIGKDE